MNEIPRLLFRAVVTAILLAGALFGGPVVWLAILAAHSFLKDETPVEPPPRRSARGYSAAPPLAERLLTSRSAADFIGNLPCRTEEG